MRLKSEVETKLFILLKGIATIIIPIYILYQFFYTTLLVFSFLFISKYFLNARKKKPHKPGQNISWFAKQLDSLTVNGSSCLERHGFTILDRLYVSTEEIAKGSNGTVVFKGVYEGRKVAVKRLLNTVDNVALRQIQHLVVSDQHPNIVRFHGVKRDKEYVYIVLERCFCSLSDLVSLSRSNQMPLKTTKHDIKVWKSNGYPSALLLKLMRDMVHGLVHLHELGIFQVDITPQNVMIAKGIDLTAKLSEIGIAIAESGSPRWCQRRAAEIFSLGSVFYSCLSLSGHSSESDHHLEDLDIGNCRMSLNLVRHVPEAVDLLSHLLDSNPKMRPMAKQVLHHPLFWDSEMRLSFLRDVSDRLTQKGNRRLSMALESVGQQVFGAGWNEKMESELLDDINRCRAKDYEYKCVRHLLRVVRNKLNHYHESPKKIKELIGSLPEGLDSYFSCRYPRLLMEVYKVVILHCWPEKCFERYFGVDSLPIV